MLRAIRGWLLFCGALALALPGYANVTFDVTMSFPYPLVGTTQVYSFRMEFADANGAKTEDDLISTNPAKDFLDERLITDGTPWPLITDGATDLTFDPTTLALTFTSADRFQLTQGSSQYTTTGDILSSSGYISGSCTSLGTGAGACGVQGPGGTASGTIIVTRVSGTVPTPSVLALLALGLPLLAWTVRRQRGTRLAASGT